MHLDEERVYCARTLVFILHVHKHTRVYTDTYIHTQAKWKEQLAQKKEEEAMANRLAANANSMFAIGA
jgi:hypothetical protein